MSRVGLVVVRLSFEWQRVVGELRALLMDHFVRSPVLQFVLVCGLDGVRGGLSRKVWSLLFLRLYFEILKPALVLCLAFNLMRIDNFVFLLNIEGLKVMGVSNRLHSVVASVLSLVDCVDTFRVVVSNVLVNHLSSSRSAHVMLIILYKVHRCLFRCRVKSISNGLLCIWIVVSRLHYLLILHRTVASCRVKALHSVRVLGHDLFFLLISLDLGLATLEIIHVCGFEIVVLMMRRVMSLFSPALSGLGATSVVFRGHNNKIYFMFSF